MRVIGEFPNDFFIAGDLEGLRLFAHKFRWKIIANDSISIRQTLAPGRQSQRIARKLILLDSPDDLLIGVQFYYSFGMSEGDEQMPIGQINRFVRKSIDRNRAEQRAVGPEFYNLFLIHQTNPIMPIGRLAGAAELV